MKTLPHTKFEKMHKNLIKKNIISSHQIIVEKFGL